MTMKILLISTFFTSIIFLVVDILWLSLSVKLFYRPQLGNLLTDKPIMWAAILFYFVYVIGLSIIILQPSLNSDSISKAFWTGIIFGFVAYGTYNFTNMATIKGWSPYVTIVDFIWGGFLTGSSSAIGIYLAKKFFS